VKILLCAYACSPFYGSEPGVGWSFVRALAEKHELYVITEQREFQHDITRYLDEHPELRTRMHFFYVSRIRWSVLERICPAFFYWTYQHWCKDALEVAIELQQVIGFDIAHQLTITGFREPGYLWRLGIPFVWGPIGGIGLIPWRLLTALGFYGAFYFLSYNVLNWLQTRFLNRPKQAAQAAGIGLLAATSVNRDGALKYWGCPSTVLSEVALPCEPVSKIRRRGRGEPLRIIWAGLLIPRKALNLGLEALALLPPSIDWTLDVWGDGPRKVAWQKLTTRRGIARRCRFRGVLPREEFLEAIRRAHVMLITSVKESTPSIVTDALAMGLPIVCLNHFGFVDAVTDKCGIKISITTPKQVVKRLSAALEKLARDEVLRQSLAEGSLERAFYFSWKRRTPVLEKIYRSKLAELSSRHVHQPSVSSSWNGVNANADGSGSVRAK
jgi:glycosyltransferase involved in cell wall biosynthesis